MEEVVDLRGKVESLRQEDRDSPRLDHAGIHSISGPRDSRFLVRSNSKDHLDESLAICVRCFGSRLLFK